jgi:hypothetical protein
MFVALAVIQFEAVRFEHFHRSPQNYFILQLYHKTKGKSIIYTKTNKNLMKRLRLISPLINQGALRRRLVNAICIPAA